MIIDVNTYIGHWPFRQLRNNTPEGLVQVMDKAGIDVSVVSSLNSVFYKDTQEGNEELYEGIKQFEGRFVPFATINPVYTGWRKDFLYCVEKLGMKGLELYPYYHMYDLTCQPAVELMSLAGELGLPVHLPCAIVNLRQRHWMDTEQNLSIAQVEKVLRLCHKTDFIITNWPANLIAGQLKTAASERSGRVLYDFARVEVFRLGGGPSAFEKLLKDAGADNIVFGSAAPFQYTAPQFVRLEYSGLGEAELEKIMWKNLKELLKI